MNADEFAFKARSYGFYQFARHRDTDGSYVITARRFGVGGKESYVSWEGINRDEDGKVSSSLLNLISESNQVQKVVDEIRAN